MRIFHKKSKYSDEYKVYLALLDTSNRLVNSDKEFLKSLDKSDKEFITVDIESNLQIFRLERLVLCLSTIPLHLKKLGLDNSIIDFCYNQILTDFNTDFIKNLLNKIDLHLETHVLERYKLYSEEIRLFLTMNNPHPGRMLWYLFNPLSKIMDSKESELIDIDNLPNDMISSIAGYEHFENTTQSYIFELLPESIKICLKDL